MGSEVLANLGEVDKVVACRDRVPKPTVWREIYSTSALYGVMPMCATLGMHKHGVSLFGLCLFGRVRLYGRYLYG